jgi:hypothetical protein
MDASALRELSVKLADLRKTYYFYTEDAEQKAQQNGIRYEKSALALVYLEAAAYLKWGAREFRERIIKLLYIAHLLNVRIGGNESSELNGEILASCEEPPLRSVLSLAMRRDDDAVIRMRDLIARQHHAWALKAGREAMESLSERPSERGRRIQEILGLP